MSSDMFPPDVEQPDDEKEFFVIGESRDSEFLTPKYRDEGSKRKEYDKYPNDTVKNSYFRISNSEFVHRKRKKVLRIVMIFIKYARFVPPDLYLFL